MAGARYDLEPTFRALLLDLGISPARVLRRAGLPRDLFARRPIELSVAEHDALWQALDDEARHDAGPGQDGDEDAATHALALRLGRAISVEMFSPPLFAALCSQDLASAAGRIARYKPLIGPLRLDVTQPAEGALTVTMLWPRDSVQPRLLVLAELLFWVALARIGTRVHVVPTTVTAPGSHPAAGRAPSRATTDLLAHVGVPIRDGDTAGITFSALDAQRPFLTSNEAMWRLFAPDLRRRLFDLEASASTAERVRAALHETLPTGDASITGVTSQLATTPRTLQRQLSREGTSFQEVLTGTRTALARHYLGRGHLRTSEIAFLLGYDDTNSFYRAFKTWTGSTPEAYRTATSTRVGT